jgi:hypothetical protein
MVTPVDVRANGIYKDPWMVECKVSIGLNRSIVDECDERDLKQPGKVREKKRGKKKRKKTNDDQDGNGIWYTR